MTRGLVVAAATVAMLAAACSTQASSSTPPTPTPRLASAVTKDCPTGVGAAAALPKLTLPCLGGGTPVSLPALTGTPTIINIWASWCLPCQREVPALQALYTAAGARVRVLGVDMEDSDGSALDFAAHVGMRYPSVVDRNGDVLRRLGFAGPPATVFLDASGAVVFRQAGQFTDSADLRAKVRRYLKTAL